MLVQQSCNLGIKAKNRFLIHTNTEGIYHKETFLKEVNPTWSQEQRSCSKFQMVRSDSTEIMFREMEHFSYYGDKSE